MALELVTAFVVGLVGGSGLTLLFIKRRMESQLRSLRHSFDELSDTSQV